MVIGGKSITDWLIGTLALLALLVIGKSFLVPLVFAVMIWAVLNALRHGLVRLRLPRWVAWFGSFIFLIGATYWIVHVIGRDASALATEAPSYVARLDQLLATTLAPLGLGLSVKVAFQHFDVTSALGQAATSVSNWVFAFVQILIYVGFLLAEQDHMALKFTRLQPDHTRAKSQAVLHDLARQVQSYLGISAILSVIMAAACYVLCLLLGVEFADFWALVLFLLTFIPAIGAVGVVFPALMALVQFGTFGPALIIAGVLGVLHFVLMNVAETVILGHTLNLSAFAIIAALTFWGLVWGLPGLFLAVPLTAAIGIICHHTHGARWVSILLSAPRHPRHAK